MCSLMRSLVLYIYINLIYNHSAAKNKSFCRILMEGKRKKEKTELHVAYLITLEVRWQTDVLRVKMDGTYENNNNNNNGPIIVWVNS